MLKGSIKFRDEQDLRSAQAALLGLGATPKSIPITTPSLPVGNINQQLQELVQAGILNQAYVSGGQLHINKGMSAGSSGFGTGRGSGYCN